MHHLVRPIFIAIIGLLLFDTSTAQIIVVANRDTKLDPISCESGSPIPVVLDGFDNIDIDSVGYEIDGDIDQIRVKIAGEWGGLFAGSFMVYDPSGPTPPDNPPAFLDQTGNRIWSFMWDGFAQQLNKAVGFVNEQGVWEDTPGADFEVSFLDSNTLLLQLPVNTVFEPDARWAFNLTDGTQCETIGVDFYTQLASLPVGIRGNSFAITHTVRDTIDYAIGQEINLVTTLFNNGTNNAIVSADHIAQAGIYPLALNGNDINNRLPSELEGLPAFRYNLGTDIPLLVGESASFETKGILLGHEPSKTIVSQLIASGVFPGGITEDRDFFTEVQPEDRDILFWAAFLSGSDIAVSQYPFDIELGEDFVFTATAFGAVVVDRITGTFIPVRINLIGIPSQRDDFYENEEALAEIVEAAKLEAFSDMRGGFVFTDGQGDLPVILERYGLRSKSDSPNDAELSVWNVTEEEVDVSLGQEAPFRTARGKFAPYIKYPAGPLKLSVKDVSNDNSASWTFNAGAGSAYTAVVYSAGGEGKRAGFDLLVIDGDGNTIETMVSVASESESSIPRQFALHEVFPNPFKQSATVSYDLPASSNVTLRVYDLLGQELRTLVSGQLPAGTHQATWDGRTAAGTPVASGAYLFRIEADSYMQTRPVVVVR